MGETKLQWEGECKFVIDNKRDGEQNRLSRNIAIVFVTGVSMTTFKSIY